VTVDVLRKSHPVERDHARRGRATRCYTPRRRASTPPRASGIRR